jgi:hypothetical protein
MKNVFKSVLIAAVTISTISCTMGDKGDEGRTDTTKVDTSGVTNSTTSGSKGTGISPDPSVNTGKGSTMQKDTVKSERVKPTKQ